MPKTTTQTIKEHLIESLNYLKTEEKDLTQGKRDCNVYLKELKINSYDYEQQCLFLDKLNLRLFNVDYAIKHTEALLESYNKNEEFKLSTRKRR